MAKQHTPLDGSTPLPLFLTGPQVAELLGVHPATIRQWRHQKRGPAYLKPNGGPCRYERAVLLAWVASRTIDAAPVDDEIGAGPAEPEPGPVAKPDDETIPEPPTCP